VSGNVSFVIGLLAGVLGPLAIYALFRLFVVEVEDEEAVLVTSFGKRIATWTDPGLHVLPTRPLPWVRLYRVSLQRDFQHFEKIHVNDARGTTLVVDLWLEYRVVDPARAVFQVADWRASLQNVVTHAAISLLGSREFQDILTDHSQLGKLLQAEIAEETARWGVQVELVFLRDLSLLPEVARHVFASVAARLELAKAHIDEEGRQRVALLEAETAAKIAALVADAKGQYPAAVGRALERLSSNEPVLAAYEQLYELSLAHPHRTVVFQGFEPGEVRSMDAAMVASPPGDAMALVGHGRALAAPEPSHALRPSR
jgi:regulator of protease activity HflC (stomatin/prohibitin superfamily)